MKKILFLADASSIHTIKWVDYFTHKNFIVEIISLLPAENQKYTVHLIDSKSYQNRESNLKYNRFRVFFDSIIYCRKMIKKIKPDLLHAHFASSYGLFGALSGFKPYFVSIWGYDAIIFPKQNIINKLLLRFVFNKADKIFATSDYLCNESKQYTINNIIKTPFGIENNNCHYPKKENDYFVIGITKGLRMLYGFSFLLEAINISKEIIPNIQLQIIGDGEDKEIIIKLIKKMNLEKNVKLFGKVPHNKIMKHISSFDIAIFPSIEYESFGVAVLEVATCGIPAIVSNIGGLPEVIIDNETGFLVPPKNADSIAEKIILLFKNKKLRDEMGINARKFIQDHYQWKNNAEIMLKEYREILEK